MQCQTCGGSGALVIGNQPVACPVCTGSGQSPFSFAFQVYEVGPLALLANGVSSITQQIKNYDFLIDFLVVVSTSSNATALITDTTSGYQFSNQEVHLANMYGTAQNPFPLPVPYKLKKNAVIKINATDLSGAPNTLFLGFIGRQDLNS